MRNFFKNNYNLRRSIYTLCVIILAILFYRFTENIHIGIAVSSVLNVLSPFIIGIIIAYILNCITNYIERRVLVKLKIFKSNTPKIQKRKRKISILISFICLVGIIVGIFAYIIPEMVSSIENIVSFIVKMDYTTIHTAVNKFLIKNGIYVTPEVVNGFLQSFIGFFENLADGLEYIPNMISSVIEYSISVASSVVNIILGIVISIYILLDKETIVIVGKKVIRAVFSEKICRKLTICVKEINHTFNQFFVSKLIDSCIIGIIYYIIAIIFGFPYPSFCALIIGLTNMIPYFGPFIGAIPVAALTFLVEPISAIGVIIAVFVLQQFDGIYLGPKIMGESINLNPVCVIFAIIVGGAIAGPVGMFFGVPLFSVIIKFAMAAVNDLYNKKYKKTVEVKEPVEDNKNV